MIAFEDPPPVFFASDKFPKSAAFPVVENVKKSIVSLFAGDEYPPHISIRVGEPIAIDLLLFSLKSPKSTAFPVCAIVIYSAEFIVYAGLGASPPALINLVPSLQLVE